MRIPDQPGVLSRVMTALGEAEINIEDLTLHHFSRSVGGDLVLFVAGRAGRGRRGVPRSRPRLSHGGELHGGRRCLASGRRPARRPPRSRFAPAARGLTGTLRVPGDKSISHRAVLLGAVNDGPGEGHRLPALGRHAGHGGRGPGPGRDRGGRRGDALVVHGRGWEGLREPEDVIDVRNAGTLIRLLPGLVASLPFLVRAHRRREHPPPAHGPGPGAAGGHGRLGRGAAPGTVCRPSPSGAGSLRGMTHDLTVASAQVKSCLLLAGLRAAGETTVVEPGASRDHTERMIRLRRGPGEREEDRDGARRRPRLAGRRACRWSASPCPAISARPPSSWWPRLLIARLGGDRRQRRPQPHPHRAALDVLDGMGARLEVDTSAGRWAPSPWGASRARDARADRRRRRARPRYPASSTSCPLSCWQRPEPEGVSRLRGAARAAGQGERPAGRHGRPPAGSGRRGDRAPRRHGRHGRPAGLGGRPGGLPGRPPSGHGRSHRRGGVADGASRSTTSTCIAVSYPGFVATVELPAPRPERAG